MSFPFTNKPLNQGVYEPEGIYLDAPFGSSATLVQRWGSNPEFYGSYQYNGVPLKGYIGIGFDVELNTYIIGVDQGRVSEINIEPGGLERYIKLEHWWGESLYARLNTIKVESGQQVQRGTELATAGKATGALNLRFHLGIRIHPYNRFDGWGGFSDPIPFLNPVSLGNNLTADNVLNGEQYPPLPMSVEKNEMRRP